MTRGTLQKRLVRSWWAVAVAIAIATAANTARAQLLYSFEPDLQGWGPTGFGGSDLISVTHSTEGSTDGTHSMAVERGNAIGTTDPRSWDVNIGSAAAGEYAIFQAVAAEPDRFALDFDVTLTPNSFGGGVMSGPLFAISVSANSSAAGENNFNALSDVIPQGEIDANLIGAGDVPELGTHHYSVPLSSAPGGAGLYLAPDSTYYQLNLGSTLTNALFQPGAGGRGAIYYVDNVRFRELPETFEETIFSWETPDDPETPGVNEQFEGWVGGNFPGNPPHEHAISTTGATDGTHALEIDRTTVSSQDFTWGSLFTLTADTNPDPEIEEIDPVIQARIADLIAKIEGAESVAFDVTYQYQDRFPLPDPTYTNFAVHFSDESGVFYQQGGQDINVAAATEPTTVAVEIPLNQFVDANTGTLNLKTDGFVDDSGFFRIGISSATDGPQIYQIDNFRLVSLVPDGLPGDYNDDGNVDAADYVVWRKNQGTTNPLPNDPDGGTIGNEQYDTWLTNFGSSTGGGSLAAGPTAVPEPSSLALLIGMAVAGLPNRRRRTRLSLRAHINPNRPNVSS
jgi:hypothetical protein